MRILSVFGTRPEAIKMAPVVKTLEETTGIESLVAVTAQHREMLDQVLDLFSITADFDLDLMRPGQTLEGITAEALKGVSEVLERLIRTSCSCMEIRRRRYRFTCCLLQESACGTRRGWAAQYLFSLARRGKLQVRGHSWTILPLPKKPRQTLSRKLYQMQISS